MEKQVIPHIQRNVAKIYEVKDMNNQRGFYEEG